MTVFKKHIAEKRMNELGKARIPFIFIIDFEGENTQIIPLDEINPKNILYNFNGVSNQKKAEYNSNQVFLKKHPISKQEFEKSFSIVKKNLDYGNSYLTNLTFSTPVDLNISLKDVFFISQAKYKLWYKDQFVVFSPEIFIKINDGKIYSHPMKGTIDANIENAQEKLLTNKKERAEHITIVDLIRNDLNMVAKNIRVEKFSYIDEIKTSGKNILQLSSKISGDLNSDIHKNLGNILFKLLPAGSISGAPKQKTVEIIKEAETHQRGYYTGVCGIFDGENLDSGVMIRYIENQNGQLIYKSGGGITVNSEPDYEYNEMIDKIYVPIP
jgi:para-aminobenzoate synthetase component 1